MTSFEKYQGIFVLRDTELHTVVEALNNILEVPQEATTETTETPTNDCAS